MRNYLLTIVLKYGLIPVLIILANSSSLQSQQYDSTMKYSVIMFIGHINNDAVKDTIIGVANYNRRFTPRFIVWGHDESNTGIPDSLKVPYSNLIYPEWEAFQVKCSVKNFNADSLNDLIFFMWGKTPQDTTLKDTAKAVILFGQSGLDTLSCIDITLINDYLTTPYVGMSLTMGVNFVNPQITDFSYTTTYKLNKSFDMPEIPHKNIVEEAPDVHIRLYPNPAVYYTNLELNNIKPGDYIFQIINSTGVQLDEFKIQVEKTNTVSNIIDLQKYASGVYYIRITTGTKLLGTFPIIVIH